MRLLLLVWYVFCSYAHAKLVPLPENVVYANQIEPQGFSYAVREPTVLKTAAGMTSAEAGKIPFGSRVTVLDRPTFVEAKYGVKQPWYKVRGGKGDKSGTIGYVWGGDLAIAARDLEGGALVLVKLDFEKDPGNQLMPTATAYTITDKGRQQVAFRPAGFVENDSYPWQINIEDLGVTNWKGSNVTFFEVVSSREACDYGNSRALFIWNAKELLPGPTAHFQSTDFGYQNSKFILPGQKDGKPNKVVIETTTGQYAEEGEAPPPQRKLAEWP